MVSGAILALIATLILALIALAILYFFGGKILEFSSNLIKDFFEKFKAWIEKQVWGVISLCPWRPC